MPLNRPKPQQSQPGGSVLSRFSLNLLDETANTTTTQTPTGAAMTLNKPPSKLNKATSEQKLKRFGVKLRSAVVEQQTTTATTTTPELDDSSKQVNGKSR